MTALNEDAKAALRDAGISQAAWARANYPADGRWHGDACGCPDDRCIGYHHDAGDECGCLRTLLADYLSGEGFFALGDDKAGGSVAGRCPDCGRSSCTGENCYWPGDAGLRPGGDR